MKSETLVCPQTESFPEMQKISFIDLKKQQKKILPQIEKNIRTVLSHGRYILGPEVRKLERQLAK